MPTSPRCDGGRARSRCTRHRPRSGKWCGSGSCRSRTKDRPPARQAIASLRKAGRSSRRERVSSSTCTGSGPAAYEPSTEFCQPGVRVSSKPHSAPPSTSRPNERLGEPPQQPSGSAATLPQHVHQLAKGRGCGPSFGGISMPPPCRRARRRARAARSPASARRARSSTRSRTARTRAGRCLEGIRAGRG